VHARRRPAVLSALIALGLLGPALAGAGAPVRAWPDRLRPSSYGVQRTRWSVGVGARAFLARPKSPARSLGSPTVLQAFDAIPRTGARWPGDPTGAEGDGWILTAANGSFALYDPSGEPVLGPSPYASLFRFPAGTDSFGARVVYDQYRRTFVLAFLARSSPRRQSWILLVSIPDGSASDTTTWCGTRIVADRLAGDGPQWAADPALGYDAGRVTLATDMRAFGGSEAFAYAQVLSIPKDGLYDCDRALTFDTMTGRATRNPDGSQAFGLRPAASVGPHPSAQYLVSFEPRASALVLWRVRSSGTGASLARVALPVERVRRAPLGSQAGGATEGARWRPGDLRPVNAFYDAVRGRVYAAHAIRRNLRPDPSTGHYVEAVVRWYEIRPRARIGESRVTRFGTVGAPETDAGWPAVATDGAGNLFVVYSRASEPDGEYLSTWVAVVPPRSTVAETTLVAPGEAAFKATRGPEPWGTAAAITRDPGDPSRIAIVDQYARADRSGPTRDWQEVVAIVSAAS
jgi:hypothetical protein